MPKTSDGRVLFFLPFFQRTLVGTTDIACSTEDAFTPTNKEKEYLSQLKEFYVASEQTPDEVEIEGVLISKKLITRESKRSCPVCNTYSFKSNDDVYMSKFDCCEKCYIQWVEGREERWLKGWRP